MAIRDQSTLSLLVLLLATFVLASKSFPTRETDGHEPYQSTGPDKACLKRPDLQKVSNEAAEEKDCT